MAIRTALALRIMPVTATRLFKYNCVTGWAMVVVVGNEAGSAEMFIADGTHIDPDESLNMSRFNAFEWTQVTPQSCWVNDVAPENIPGMLVTCNTFHLDKSWLKAVARRNIADISVTCDTFQLDKSWLKDVAPANMAAMLVTCDTSHLERSWLKAVAPANMLNMV